MDQQTFVRWVELPEAQPVCFGDLPGLIAGALHESEFAQAAAENNLEAELKALVDSGELMVRDPLTLGRHTFPLGAALRRAVLLPREDLRPLLASRGIGLRLIPYGTSHWTIENAAAAIAEQEGWHQGARDTLRGQMVQAAADGTLTVRHPDTGLPYRPDRLRDSIGLVTPADVNAWLARDPELSLRWMTHEPAAAEPVLPKGTGKKWTADRLADLSAYRDKHGTNGAAEHFGISAARVRALLPTGKPATKGYSAFTHRPK
jgi:hypothetical protein